MNRRDLLKIFGGLAFAPVALKAALLPSVAAPTRQSFPKTSQQPLSEIKNNYHPKIDYMPLLREMGGVTFSDWPCFYVDWNTMDIRYVRTDIHHSAKNFMLVSAKTIKLRSKEWGLEFIKLNKKNVVVHDFSLQPWTEFPNVCSDPRPFLRYAQRPEVFVVYPA